MQTSPTECGVSDCDRAASTMRRPWPTRGCCGIKKHEGLIKTLQTLEHILQERITCMVFYQFKLVTVANTYTNL